MSDPTSHTFRFPHELLEGCPCANYLDVHREDKLREERTERHMRLGAFKQVFNVSGPSGSFLGMCHLVQQEAVILDLERRYRGAEDEWGRVAGEVALYVEMRKVAQDYLRAAFEPTHEDVRLAHNAIARRRLDQSDGTSRAYVIPPFYYDGTHQKPGARDQGW